jgi:epoxyqueuosine reductase
MPLSEWIKERGRALGFDRVGVAPATDLPELSFFPEWLERGYAGQMDYMQNPKRADVRALMPEARSVICCALAYDTDHPRSTEVPPDPERGWLSRYAWGDDYHKVVGEKLKRLQAALAEEVGPGLESRLYVDTGPVLERVYGKLAGLGWQAKNTCLLDAELGSFFFVGLLVTNLELSTDLPPPDGCGSCTLCIEACPTGAIVAPYMLDARRCISYLTIELREAIPEELRPAVGRHVFGCDICQDVCPYNHQAKSSPLASFEPRRLENHAVSADEEAGALQASSSPAGRAGARPLPQTHSATPHRSRVTGRRARITSLFHPRLAWLARLGEEEFQRVFRGSAVKRVKRRGLLRNTLVAMGNSGNQRFRPLLEEFAASDDALLAEHARWALGRLGLPSKASDSTGPDIQP